MFAVLLTAWPQWPQWSFSCAAGEDQGGVLWWFFSVQKGLCAVPPSAVGRLQS